MNFEKLAGDVPQRIALHHDVALRCIFLQLELVGIEAQVEY